MPQDAHSGAQANAYGHETARRIALTLGAVSVSDNSNEFAYEGKLITIKCARRDTIDIGVTYKMLDRVDIVVGAFEVDDGAYKLIAMSPALYKLYMRDSKAEGTVGLVRRKTFEQLGLHMEGRWVN